MKESAAEEKAEGDNLKAIRAALMKAMADFKKSHPGGEAYAHVRHGNNRHAIKDDGSLDMNPSSGDMIEPYSPQTPEEMTSVAHKIYPKLK